MPNTFTKIAEVTVGAGGAASIDFTSIPQTYTDLQLVFIGRSAGGGYNDDIYLTVNSSTANLSFRYLYGNGTSAASTTSTGRFGSLSGTSATANTFGTGSLYIPNYTGSTNKSMSAETVSENNAAQGYQTITAGLWSSTAAITALGIYFSGQNLVQYSSATLYGITKGSGGATVS